MWRLIVAEADAAAHMDEAVVHTCEPPTAPVEVHLGDQDPFAARGHRHYLCIVAAAACPLHPGTKPDHRARLRRAMRRKVECRRPTVLGVQHLGPPVAVPEAWPRRIAGRAGPVDPGIAPERHRPLADGPG